MRKTLLVPVLATALLAGCSWGIKLTDAGRQVRTDWDGTMAGCQNLGKISVSVSDQLGPIDRNPVKVRDELEVMARNAAADVDGADTVHPLAEPTNGSQPWGMYHCGTTTPASPQAAPAPAQSGGAKTYPIGSGSL